MEQILSEKRNDLDTLVKQESDLIPNIDQEVLFKFERIIKSKAGVGIVPIHDNVCTGCHMQLPTQFVNNVRIGKDFMFCPYCSRILFFEELRNSGESTVSVEMIADDQEGAFSDLVDLDEFDI